MAQVVTYPPGLRAAAAELGVQLPEREEFDGRDDLLELGEDFQTAAMHGEDSHADFGGFSFKKLGRGIGKGLKKAGKGIGKVASKVAKNPVVQVLNPAAAIAIHTTSKAAGMKGTIKGPLGKVVDLGASVAMKAAGPAAAPMSALGSKFGPQVARAAGTVKTLTGITGGKAVAFAVPNLKIPIKQAMAGADKLLGDANVKNAQAVVRNTKALAALGDPAAKRGLSVLNAVAHVRLAANIPAGKKAIPTPLLIKPAALTVKKSPAQVKQLAVKKVVAAKKTTAKKTAGKTAEKTFWQKVVSWFKG